MPRYFSFLLNLTLAMHLPVLVFFFLCHREIVELAFAGKFLGYSWLLPLITAFALLGALSETATLIAQYQEKAGIVLLSKIFAVLNIGGLLLLIPMLGILGAVLSTGGVRRTVRARQGVVLATGGFAHNAAMRKSFMPAPTPGGVPVVMMSPGISVMNWLT